MANQQKVIYGLSNRAIFNDLERPQTKISRLCHAEHRSGRSGARYRHSYNELQIGTYTNLKSVISNDLDGHRTRFKMTSGPICFLAGWRKTVKGDVNHG